MLIPFWFAIAYPLVVFFFFLVLYGCSKQYPKRKHYSILSRTISGLGNEKYKSSRLFKEDFFIFPIFNLILIYFLLLFLYQNNLSIISIYFLAAGELAALATSFATENFANKTKLLTHNIISGIAFSSSMIGFIIFGFSIISLTNIMVILGLFSLLIGLITGISFISNKKHNPDNIRPFFKNYCMWEWLMFFSLILCFISSYMIILVF